MMKPFFFAVLIVSALFSACSSYAQEQGNLDVDQFEKALVNSAVQVLDVRTIDEFQSGHLKHALLADWTKKEQFKERVAALDKLKPVYTYCLSGGRSSAAAQYLRDNGYTTYNMTGGIAKWRQAGKPLVAEVKARQINQQVYQSMIPQDKTVLVDISANWCPPCIKMKPLIDSLAQTNRPRFTLVTIDGGAQSALVKELSVDGFPTFIIYKNGKETWRKSGVISPAEIIKKL